MKLQTLFLVPWRRRRAFTLTELMVTMSLVMIVMAGVIYGHVAGLKLYGLTRAKLGASDAARSALSRLLEEIRSARRVQVGTGTASSFTQIEEGFPQRGNALMIHPTLSTNQWVRYYLDPATSKLLRIDHDDSRPLVIAEYVSNTVVFAAQDFQGNVLSNYFNNRVIAVDLEFYQVQYPITPIGTPGAYFDYYRLTTRATRRTLE
ncbi:prepilin-type N-terminal cleavage/methylation domain-containing protein [Fontisphaera persica]|uniref:PilW family protein n=1 Tax=Fontisphaera persica TaxID=2974023 RepID=UPI0024C01223|nr:prepilin-type N-terminal cleavage/methylation domain-containing protein [Fontisphaera persica]WCJ59024.1 prepilin-type N-terminal cleavage/methylation domain-containing protein [Fontisphaera persica]